MIAHLIGCCDGVSAPKGPVFLRFRPQAGVQVNVTTINSNPSQAPWTRPKAPLIVLVLVLVVVLDPVQKCDASKGEV